MIRRTLATVVALMLVVPALASAAPAHAARATDRVPSAQLQSTGSGFMAISGRLAVNGSIPEGGSVLVIDRARDAKAILSGQPLAFDRRGRARVARASGILFVTGSDITVQVTGTGLTFSIAGFGRARFLGEGTYRLNSGEARAWTKDWIRIAPTPSAQRRRIDRCASCSSSAVPRH